MGLPDKPVKRVPKKQAPLGSRKGNSLKVQDGDSGKVEWRQMKEGSIRDYDGDAKSAIGSNKDMQLSHKLHGGSKSHNMPKDRRLPESPEE